MNMKSSSVGFNGSLLEDVIRNLFTYLGITEEHCIGKYVSRNHISGNLIFPVSIRNNHSKLEEMVKNDSSLQCLIDDIKIDSNSNLYLVYLNQNSIFQSSLQAVLNCEKLYGANSLCGPIFKLVNSQQTFQESDQLCSYRLHLCSMVLERFLLFVNSGQSANRNMPSSGCDSQNISICNHKTKIQRCSHTTFITCRTEINELNGEKNIDMSYDSYKMLREKDVIRNDEFKNDDSHKVSSIVSACITFDLLTNKLNMPVYLNLTKDRTMSRNSSSKGAVFVLYTYARLAAIINKFEEFVQDNSVEVPSIQETDFSILTSSEEKVMLYNYILMFPVLVKEILTELLNKKDFPVNKLCLFLAQFSSTISKYYRSTRVLMRNNSIRSQTALNRKEPSHIFDEIELMIDLSRADADAKSVPTDVCPHLSAKSIASDPPQWIILSQNRTTIRNVALSKLFD